MDDRWLSMKEICTYLGVSHDTNFPLDRQL